MMKNKLVISLLAILAIVLSVFAYLISTKALVSPMTFEKEITKVERISEEDDVDSIKADLDETDVDRVDIELSEIDAELE